MGIKKASRRTRESDLERRVTSVVGELRQISDQLLSEIAERKSAEQELQQTQETIRALLNAPPDSALLISPEGTILAANETAVKRLRRYTPTKRGDLVGLCVYDVFPVELAETRKKRNEAVISSGKPARYEDERNGHWYDNSIFPVEGENDEIVGLAIFSRDITERKQAEHAIRQSQETIRALLNAPTDAALLVSADGTILAANDTAARRLASHAGIDYNGNPEKVHGLSVYDLLPPDLSATRRARNEQVVATGKPGRFEDERNGNWFDNSIYPILNIDGETTSLAIFSRDITDLKKAEERFKHLAYHDSLTGLPNRANMQARMDVALAEARRSGDSVTVMCLDVNGFKDLNDSLGHAAGDQLLAQMGTRLAKVIRGHDSAARFGGDEFVLLFPESRAKAAPGLAQRVLKTLHAPYTITGIAVEVTTSLGISVFPDDGLDSQSLLRLADAAMYCAKAKGGGYALASEAPPVVSLNGHTKSRRTRKLALVDARA